MADNFDFSELKKARMQDIFSAYLGQGWTLVPVDINTRKRAKPEGGDQETRDLKKAMEWNEADYGVAVATGRDFGIVALRYQDDIGKSTLEALQTARGVQLATVSAKLFPRGNILLFRSPEIKLRSVKDFAPGLDLLAENAYFSPVIWDAECTELADLPDFILSLATGQTTFENADLADGGNLAVLNDLTAAEAARVYHEFGLEMVAVDDKGQRLTEEGMIASPEFWQDNPEVGIAIVTGTTSDVVGLWVQDLRNADLNEKFGSLPLPQIRGRQTVACFRAPSECFPSKVLYDDIKYLGENDILPLPPSVINGSKLRWQVAKDFSPELPELMPKLRKLLTDPEALVAAKIKAQPQPQPQPKQQQPSQSKESGSAALRYSSEGWAVFPLWTGGKTPKTKNGLKAATFDREQIIKWWKKYKNANVAVRTGMISGIVVLDVDTKKGQPGLQSLAELEAQHGRMDTLRAYTPTGGLHLFFRAPMEALHRRIGFLPGLDFLAEDSYVVVAPSQIGGREYRWESPTATIAELPDFLLNLVSAKVSKKPQNAAKPHEELTYTEAFRGVQEGNRNDTIFHFACKLRLEEWVYDEALVLVKTAAGNCEPPLEEDEVIRCLDSAWRYNPPTALTDMGNSERFVARCGDSIRYIQEKDRWLVWADHWWETNMRAVYRMARGTIKSLRDEAMAETSEERKKQLYSHCRKSESAQALENMLGIASLELSVRAEDLDRNNLVAFSNGVYDPATKKLRKGCRGDLLTKHAPFPYDPSKQECLLWMEHKGSPQKTNTAISDSTKIWQKRLSKWLKERCEEGQGFSTKASDLCADFSNWVGEKVTPRRFGDLFRTKGFPRRKSNVYWYDGLRLRS